MHFTIYVLYTFFLSLCNSFHTIKINFIIFRQTITICYFIRLPRLKNSFYKARVHFFILFLYTSNIKARINDIVILTTTDTGYIKNVMI